VLLPCRRGPGGEQDGGDPCWGSFLAFDSAGSLWLSTNGSNFSPGMCHLIAYSRAQLLNAKNDSMPAPVRDLIFDSPTVWCGALAFDADGNLWVGTASDWNDAGQPGSLEDSSDWDAGAPNLFRLPAASLALDAGPDPTLVAPDISVAVPGFPDSSLAFSPIPSGLPIQP
jgi:hypothetical protein